MRKQVKWRKSENMSAVAQPTFKSIKAIRDHIILMTLGGAYLCEAPFLIRFGQGIESLITKVHADIDSLKKEFPGKFAHEIDTDGLLENLNQSAKTLQEPDKSIQDKCTIGELGQELEQKVIRLEDAIDAIRNQVEGDAPEYGGRETVSRTVKGLAYSVGNLIRFLVKALVIVLILAMIPFGYLFLTMETEGGIKKEIQKYEAVIHSRQEVLDEVNRERDKLMAQITSLESSDMSQDRLDKIEIMELQIQVHQLDKKRENLDTEIELQRNKIEKKEAELEKILKMPFWDRLLRRGSQ
jgi:hypothetical protein